MMDMKTNTCWILLVVIGLLLLSACSGTELDGDNANVETKSVQNEAKHTDHSTDTNEVVSINNKQFNQDDLAFYTAMKKIQFEINRYFDGQQYEGEELVERDSYWDEQLAYYNNVNVQLQNLMELYAMALLAEEKNYFNPVEDIEVAIAKLYEGIEEIPAAHEIINEYGKKEFNRGLNEYMDYSLLRDRVVSDLIDEMKEENPDMTDAELNYELTKRYEDLFMEQMGDLEIEIQLGK